MTAATGGALVAEAHGRPLAGGPGLHPTGELAWLIGPRVRRDAVACKPEATRRPSR
jgi:hypothetical protein